MKVKCIRGTVASGGKSLEEGKVYDISDQDAILLIGMNKVEEVTAKPTKAKKEAVAKEEEVK
jgi:hypothetical protein